MGNGLHYFVGYLPNETVDFLERLKELYKMVIDSESIQIAKVVDIATDGKSFEIPNSHKLLDGNTVRFSVRFAHDLENVYVCFYCANLHQNLVEELGKKLNELGLKEKSDITDLFKQT